MKTEIKHDCGEYLYESIRSDKILICRKCKVDVVKEKNVGKKR